MQNSTARLNIVHYTLPNMEEISKTVTLFGDKELFAVEDTFKKAIARIESLGGKIATAQQIAEASLANDKTLGYFLVAENVICFPNNRVLITSAEYSPTLKCTPETIGTTDERTLFFISKEEATNLEQIAKADLAKDPAERRVYIMTKYDKRVIPRSKFSENHPLVRFLFKDIAAQYSEFFQKNSISFLKFSNARRYRTSIIKITHSKENRAYACPLMFNDIAESSLNDRVGNYGLMAWNNDGKRGITSLNTYDWVAGVRFPKPAEPTTYETVIKKYGINSPEDLDKILARL